MDTNTDKMNSVVKIGGKPFGASHRWAMPEKYNALTFPLNVRSKASEEGKHFAYLNRSDGKTDATKFGQYGLIELKDGLEKIPSLDLTVQQNGKAWVKKHFESRLSDDSWDEKDLECSKLFVATVDNGKRGYTNPEFIISLVSPEGFISDFYSSEESFLFDNLELAERLETDLQLDPNLSIIVIDDDGEALNIARHAISEMYGNNENRLVIVSRPDFDKSADSKSALPERVYKPSQIKIKKVGFFVGFAAVAIAGTLLLSYLTQSGARDYFNDTARWEQLRQQKNKIEDATDHLSSKSSLWDDRTYRNDTLSTFVDSLSDNLYSPNEIVSVIRHINIIFPNFASEWEFTSIRYENNNFIVRYDRLPDGKGVFFMLDRHIDELNKNSPGVNIEIHSLDDDAAGREYAVIPSIKLKRQDQVSSFNKILIEENAATEKLVNEADDALKANRQMTNFKLQYDAMPFLTKWFMFGGDNLHSDAMSFESSKLKAENEEFEAALVEFQSLEGLSIDKELIIGNKYDFVTMMQLDSFFDWTFPKSTMSFPTKDMLKDKNRKPKKVRKGKKAPKPVEIYGPSILGYEVEISTQSASDDNKVTSYGIADMNRLGEMLNKPFVHVDMVSYLKSDEQWSVLIHFFTKTQHYESKVANYTNKDV
jgi:hypothetical protein